MGINGLCKWLNDKYPNVFQNIPIASFYGKKLAIDTSIFLYKFMSPYYTFNSNWIDLFILFIINLRKTNIRPIFVFDGKPPKEKNLTQKKRNDSKQKVQQKIDNIQNIMTEIENYPVNKDFNTNIQQNIDEILQQDSLELPRKKVLTLLSNSLCKYQGQCFTITKQDIMQVKTLLDVLGLPWIQAQDEAEKYCSWLAYFNLVDGVVTSDADVIAYQCPIYIKEINFKKNICTVLCYDKLKKELEMTSKQITDFCIMSGTDYNERIPKCGCQTSFTLLKEYKSIENIQNMDTSILKYKTIRKLFTLYDQPKDFTIPVLKPINKQELQDFLRAVKSRYSLEHVITNFYQNNFEIN